MSDIINWLKALEIKPRYFIGVFVVGCLLLFLPENIADLFGIEQLRSTYRGWIGGGTIAALVFAIVQTIPIIINKVTVRMSIKRTKKTVIEKLLALQDNEWIVIAYCLSQKHPLIRLKNDEQFVERLREKHFLESVETPHYTNMWKYRIPHLLWQAAQEIEERILPDSLRNRPDIVQVFKTIDENNNNLGGHRDSF
jgi:hypothetical protein